MAALFTGALMIWQATFTGSALLGHAMNQSVYLSGERARTGIMITTAVFDSSACILELEVKNSGSVPITRFSFMDLIVRLQGGNQTTHKLTYVESGAQKSASTWQMSSGPDIWNPGETAVINTAFDLPNPGETLGVLTLVTPNGISTEIPIGPMEAPCSPSS